MVVLGTLAWCVQTGLNSDQWACFRQLSSQDPQKQWWILKNLGTQVRYCFQQFF